MPIPQNYNGAIREVAKPTDPTLGGEAFGAAAAAVDFTVEFVLNDAMPQIDQGSASDCVGQAWSYQHGFLKGKQFSVHDLYARIFIPPAGGAYISAGGTQIVADGQSTTDVDPDPSPETEENMRTPGTAADEREHVEASLVNVPNDIASIAAACKQYGGVVFGVTGSNEGFADMADPRPPLPGETTWGHCLWVKGYCTRNGKRALICKPSWPEVSVHYISEDFFASGDTFAGLALIPNDNTPMPQIVLQNLNGEIRLVCKFATVDQLNAFCAVYGLNPSVISEQVELKPAA